MLELAGVTKRFGTTVAVDRVDLRVAPGRLHALIGENGAGKSTIVNMVGGLLAPDAGTIHANGARLDGQGRRGAVAAGVGVVHQHPSLVPTMTLAENVELGRPARGWRADRAAARRDVAAWVRRTGLDVPVDVPVEQLSIGERQRAEIVTTLVWGARVLVLDEPTAVLSPFESDALLDVVTELASQGMAVLLVTHKLREVERVADEVTVMRTAAVVARAERGSFDRTSLVTAMVGEHVDLERTRTSAAIGEVRLAVDGLALGRLRDATLQVRAGEIVGVAGVAGNGQRELVDATAGLRRPERGTITVDGVDVTGRPAAVAQLGVAVLPDDRDGDALALQLPVWANAVAKRRAGIGGWRGLDRRRIDELTDAAIARLGVRPARRDVAVRTLSGGNRQRLLIGRELDEQTPVVIAAEPTRGLDPASARAVLDALEAAAARGAAVLVVASDLDELLAVATRLVVLADGEIRMDVAAAAADRATVGDAMLAGAR